MGASPATVVEIPIKIHRQVRDGWFIYTCDKLPGLYVASQDDKEAYDDLPAAISALVEETFGIECIVAFKEEVLDFQALAARAVADRTRDFLEAGAGALSFVVQCVRRDDTHA